MQWVKGRKSERVDKVRLRKELLLSGVAVNVVEVAFEKATTANVGAPHLRIGGTDAQPEDV